MNQEHAAVKLTAKEAAMYTALLAHVERETDGWGEVYLDNVVVSEISKRSRSGILSSLAKKGLYDENEPVPDSAAFAKDCMTVVLVKLPVIVPE
jgi:hypothetical protein